MRRIPEGIPVGPPERIFGCATIEAKCGVGDCTNPATLVAPFRTRKETGFWWFCEEHADALPPDPENRVGLGVILRTCGVTGESGAPCGAFATHVAMVGIRDAGGKLLLGVVCVCDRHAEDAITLLT